jgi:hypothetical protein
MKTEQERRYSPGIWLVEDNPNCKSKQHIMNIGELDSLFPYATMTQDIDDLARFIVSWKSRKMRETVKLGTKGEVSASLPCGTDEAKAILKFLAKSKEERKQFLDDFNENYRYIDYSGDLRDGTGLRIKDAYSVTPKDKKLYGANRF